MGLEVVVSDIMEEGRRRAETLLSEARTQADAIRHKAQEQAEEQAEAIRRDATKQAEAIRRQGAARADFEAKKQVLFAQKAMWDELRSDVLNALENLDEATRRRHLKSLVEAAQKEVPEGRAKVRDPDIPLVEGPYPAEGGLPGAGGLIVESRDGQTRLDLTYETLLEDLWRDVLKQESERLLAGGND